MVRRTEAMGLVCMLCGAPQVMLDALSAAKDLRPAMVEEWAPYHERPLHRHHGNESLPESAPPAAMTSIETRGIGALDTFGQAGLNLPRAAAWALQLAWQADEVVLPSWGASTTSSGGTESLV
jgi:hypothetical protein